MADVRYASRDDVGKSANGPVSGIEPTEDVPVPSWPMLVALRKVSLVVWKNLQLRGNRPVATILEVVFPLIAFVALSVMTPRNEYFDASYFPGVPWMPPACVLQYDVPVPSALLADGVSAETAQALAPELCPGAGHLAGPHVTVLFAPDTEATRALMRAACELRYAPPGIERVAYGFTTLAGAEETFLREDDEDEEEAPEASSSRRRRRHLLFGPSDPPPGPPSPPAPPAPPAWPACSPEGYADEERMARAAAAGAGGGGAAATAVAFATREGDGAVVGYEIRTSADDAGTTRALEMQERLGDVFASLAGTGDARAVSADLATADGAPTATAFRRFPLPPVYPTSTYAFVAKFLPLAVAATWTYTLLVCAGNVAYERETGLEASMRAFGLPLWTHWAGHGVACAILLGAAALFCGATVTSFGAALFTTNQSGSFVFLLLGLTVCAAITMCFVVATLATDASVAAAGAAVTWLVSYLPYAYVSRPDVAGGLGAFPTALLCFLPSSAQGLGFAAMAQWEAEGVGTGWGNLWRAPPANSAGDIGVPLGAALLMLALDFIGLAALALAVDAARFAEKRGGADRREVAGDAAGGGFASSGIVAENLRVEYPGAGGAPPKLALRGLSLRCPKDEITVLLGHNGAGKSSAISRLVGSAPPTSGRAAVGGHDAVSARARRELGFCPQHDALWDDLTVQDHLDFALRLRGTWDKKALEAKRNALLRDVELRAKKRTRAGALSGGMRRRLSVALAFAGDPAHVVLDEPTAGVDPRARRQIQALLLKKAKGKAVLVTTHHLDEAERLGTRVAILHGGALVCHGSARELKERHDVGYRLVVSLRRDATAAERKESLAASLLSTFAAATKKSAAVSGSAAMRKTGRVAREGAEAAGEISFTWPASLAACLPGALRELAREKEALGVAGYGLAAPSLDGVFKAVQKENEDEDEDEDEALSFKDDARNDVEAAARVDDAAEEDHVSVLPGKDARSPRVGGASSHRSRPKPRFSASVVAVFLASLRAFRRDRARMVATFVAPTLLLLAASAMAPFRPTPSTYGASFHVPVAVHLGTEPKPPRAFLADCGVAPFGAANASALEPAFGASRGAFETVAVEPMRHASGGFGANDVSDSDDSDDSSSERCFPEGALWRAFEERVPSGVRPRRTRDIAGVAAGAGGVARAATVWWSSARVRRAATAAVARTRARERFAAAFGGVSNRTAAEIGVASAAADAADLNASFRPWPKTDHQTRRATLASTPGPAAAAAAVVLAVSVPPCLAAAAAAKQRASGLRRVLLVAGAPKLAHWLGTAMADVAATVPATFAHAVAFCAAGGEGILGEGWARAPEAFFLFYAHAFAALACAHVVALAVGEAGAHKAFPSCLLFGALPATALVGLTYALDALGDSDGADAAVALARVFPGFAVAQGTLELALAGALARDALVAVERGKAFEWAKDTSGDGRTGTLMAAYAPRGGGVSGLAAAALVVGAAATALAFFLDGASVTARAFFERCVSSEVDVRRAIEAEGERDADVVAEETRLKAMWHADDARLGNGQREKSAAFLASDAEAGVARPPERDALRVFGLRKSYLGGASARPAVRDLWLGVKAGECFGLLGINGCGKTTTFRMAAGDLPPTAGRVAVGHPDARETIAARDAKSRAVGYCPQKDAIVGSLTVTEHMRLVAAARGERVNADAFVQSAVRAAGLRAFADVRAGSLSGGNKRKLCLAMALLGLRRDGLALLDEPTAGVDPKARETITEAIRDAAKKRRCACVVTSHAVEDVAALCDRVGVMVDGAMRCLGAPQHLCGAHGKHLTLTVHRRRPETVETDETETETTRRMHTEIDALDAFVRAAAPGASRVDADFGASSASEETSASAAKASVSAAARAFGFVEGASKEDDEALAEAKRVAQRSFAAASAASSSAASRTWELPASTDLPSVLEALERRRGQFPSQIEGYAVGQASLEDVFLDFASRGSAQSDAQMMAMEDALLAHRLALSKKRAEA